MTRVHHHKRHTSLFIHSAWWQQAHCASHLTATFVRLLNSDPCWRHCLTCKAHVGGVRLCEGVSVAGPTNFGPTAEAGTPWLQLALYTAMAQGPLTVVLVCGQRLWRLPPQLASCSHVLVWPWDLESVRAQTSPVLLESAFLLFSLNEYLSRTAIMVQPLDLPEGADLASLSAVHVPLPPLAKGTMLQGGRPLMRNADIVKDTAL